MTVLACVEVGGSGSQTVLFDDAAAPVIFDRAHRPFGARLAVAVPGIIEGKRVLAASNLNWYDVDPVAIGQSSSCTKRQARSAVASWVVFQKCC